MPASRSTQNKITVLLSDEEFERLDSYCRDRAYKKSTLVARLIRQYLDMEGYNVPRRSGPGGFGASSPPGPAGRR